MEPIASTARSGPETKSKKDKINETHRSMKSEAVTATKSARTTDGGAVLKLGDAHQDVQKFLIGIHRLAEAEAQLQV